MSCILGAMAFVVITVAKVVFFPFTIFSIISAAKTERKIEENKKYWENQGRKQRYYEVRLDTYYNYRDYNSHNEFYVGDKKYLYMVDAFMLPEEAAEKGYLTEKEALVEYNKKMVEICKILNLPIPLV